MAKAILDYDWSFSLDPAETRLMLKALGGRLKPEDVEAAKALGDELTQQRHQAANALANEMRKHALAAKESSDAQ